MELLFSKYCLSFYKTFSMDKKAKKSEFQKRLESEEAGIVVIPPKKKKPKKAKKS
ncbi:MAG: hypothetical protein WBP33_00830 [Saprospiraceae bacterium]